MNSEASTRDANVARALVKRALQIGLSLAVLAATLFLSSLRLDWGMAWAYLGASALVLTVTGIGLYWINPALIAERTETREGTKPWDRVLVALYGLCGIVNLLVSGLDERFGWTQAVPLVLQVAALILFAAADLLSSWAMWTNAFFATTVRIQDERGHRVITDGPYRVVRHPGYAGWLLCALLTPLILDSLWAFLPAVLTVVVIVVRTAREDRTLHDELDGYRDYAGRVRNRLIPGVW
jgi:protein-S-isoprenylcysteine O-methyltransferase Ste14